MKTESHLNKVHNTPCMVHIHIFSLPTVIVINGKDKERKRMELTKEQRK